MPPTSKNRSLSSTGKARRKPTATTKVNSKPALAGKVKAKPEDMEGVRAHLRQELPARLLAALESHRTFAARLGMAEAATQLAEAGYEKEAMDEAMDGVMDAKGFAAYHAACKAALAHAEGLLKLLRWADADVGAPPAKSSARPDLDDMGALIARAREALKADAGLHGGAEPDDWSSDRQEEENYDEDDGF